jgi:hypothetical protein
MQKVKGIWGLVFPQFSPMDRMAIDAEGRVVKPANPGAMLQSRQGKTGGGTDIYPPGHNNFLITDINLDNRRTDDYLF